MQERTGASPDLTVSTAAQALLAEDLDNLDEPVVTDDADDLEDEVTTEDEVDEAEDEVDESEEQDELEEDDEEPEAPPIYRVKVDGEEVEVTLDELQKGYSRTKDYTRKTQELAEQRKQAEAEVQAARAERERYAQNLAQLQQLQQMQQEKEPDWDKLYQSDPIEWVRQRELWRDKRERQQHMMQEQQRLQAQQQQEQAQQIQQIVAENRQKLLEAVPEWSDPDVGTREQQELRKFLKETGFAEDEISQIYDHRAVLVARDAMRYRQMMQKRQNLAPAKPKSKTAAPGVAHTVSENKGKSRKRQMQRLTQTGRVADAAAAIESLL